MAKSYQEGYDSTYCYENSTVLRNKLNITDKEELFSKERAITALRNVEIIKTPVKGNLDLAHLKNIHNAIFKDIYEWAGKIRSIDIAKGNMFCKPMFIESYSEEIFKRVEKNNFYMATDAKALPGKLAELTGDINALHPFREGNGRSQRVYIKYLLNATGHDMSFKSIAPEEMIQASIEAMNCDYNRFEKIYEKNILPISYKEQAEFVKNLDGTKVAAAYEMCKTKEIEQEILKAGFKPTEKLVLYMQSINKKFDMQHSVKDIKELYSCRAELQGEDKILVERLGNSFKEQEQQQLRMKDFSLEK